MQEQKRAKDNKIGLLPIKQLLAVVVILVLLPGDSYGL